jgi:hypothetical protein
MEDREFGVRAHNLLDPAAGVAALMVGEEAAAHVLQCSAKHLNPRQCGLQNVDIPNPAQCSNRSAPSLLLTILVFVQIAAPEVVAQGLCRAPPGPRPQDVARIHLLNESSDSSLSSSSRRSPRRCRSRRPPSGLTKQSSPSRCPCISEVCSSTVETRINKSTTNKPLAPTKPSSLPFTLANFKKRHFPSFESTKFPKSTFQPQNVQLKC